MKFLECFIKILLVIQEYIRSVSRIFYDFLCCLKAVLFLTVCFKEVAWCSKKVLWVIQEKGLFCFMSVSRTIQVSFFCLCKFLGGFEKVSRMIQVYFLEVLWRFPECFKEESLNKT